MIPQGDFSHLFLKGGNMDRYAVVIVPEEAKEFKKAEVINAKTLEEVKEIFKKISPEKKGVTVMRCIDLLSCRVVKEKRIAKKQVTHFKTTQSFQINEFFATFPVMAIKTLFEDGTSQVEIPFEEMAKGFWNAYFTKGYDKLSKVPILLQDGEMLIHGEKFLKAGGYVEYAQLVKEMEKAIDEKKEPIAAKITLRDRIFDLSLTKEILNPQEFTRAVLKGAGCEYMGKDGNSAQSQENKDKEKIVKIPLLTRIAFCNQTFMVATSKLLKAL